MTKFYLFCSPEAKNGINKSRWKTSKSFLHSPEVHVVSVSPVPPQRGDSHSCLLSLARVCCGAADLVVDKGKWGVKRRFLFKLLFLRGSHHSWNSCFCCYFLSLLFFEGDVGERYIQDSRGILISSFSCLHSPTHLFLFQTTSLQIRFREFSFFFFPHKIDSAVSYCTSGSLGLES